MRIFLIVLITFSSLKGMAWGQTGHRVIGLIAERHLSKKAKINIQRILGNESLAEVSSYMDFIKSDATKRHMDPWHYMTIPDGVTYEEVGTPSEGDVLNAINRFIGELQSKKFEEEDEAFALKCLIHLIGDVHQPLHVGNGEDRGGNDISVEFFWSPSNLHRVWDSGIIDEQKFSYTEYADWIDHATKEEIKKWQSDEIMTWIMESYYARQQIYTYPENGKLNYRYVYDNIDLVNQRLLQAGIRLAGVLNRIYG